MVPEIGSPLKQIRKYCMECAGSSNEVKLCAFHSCMLYPYRTGKTNRVGKTMTDEQRQVAADRLKKAREAKNGNDDL